MRQRLVAVLAALSLGAGLGACVGEDGAKPDDDGEEDKTDAWDYSNAPNRFRIEFEYRLASLPQEGEADQIPWPDDYWSYYRDSANYRWRGQQNLSPTELYDVAFNGWTPPEGYMDLQPRAGSNDDWDAEYYQQLGPLSDEVHRRRGNYQATNGRDDDGDGEIDEHDDDGYDGIETWWGICHAWAPAAVMEPEPPRAVTHNGQTFYPSDMKVLMMLNYDSTRALMLGGRCNAREVDRDENGRVTSDDCRDTNAGAFHVVVANMLGIHHRAFDEDRTYDYQVWNQPIRDFRVTELNTGLTAAEAMDVLGADGDTYTFNRDAVEFAEVRMNLRYITESHPSEQPTLPRVDNYTRTDRYHYILELDGAGEIIGGEWARSSQTNHPDFLWLPTSHGTNFRNITYAKVRGMIDRALTPDDPDDPDDPEDDVFEVEPNLSIPDNNPGGVNSSVQVTTSGNISSLRVAVDITHTYIGDLRVTLERNGREAVLHNRQGGSSDNLVQTFLVNDFNGEASTGQWTLHVSDHAGADLGTLNQWSLAVATGGSDDPDDPDDDTATYSSSGSVSIPDNNEAGAGSTITVNNNGTISGLQVRVNVEHTYIGDLVVELRHNGQVRTLHNRGGGSQDNLEATFAVSEFNTTRAAGDWELHVTDLANWDTGEIVDWSLTFQL